MRLTTLDPQAISRQLYICGGLCDGELSDNQSDGRISELFYLYSESTVSTVQESVSYVSLTMS